MPATKTKTPAVKPAAKKRAPAKKAPALEAVTETPTPAPVATLQSRAIAVVEHELDKLGTKFGEAAIVELRNLFDAIKNHDAPSKLLALARFGEEPK